MATKTGRVSAKDARATRVALLLARDRWGKTAVVRDLGPGASPRCSVGKVVLGLFFGIEGEGDTFDEAFRAADRKTATSHAEYLWGYDDPRGHSWNDGEACVVGVMPKHDGPWDETQRIEYGRGDSFDEAFRAAKEAGHKGRGER
jgi:hypothetical protein